MDTTPILHAAPLRRCDHCRTVYDVDDSTAYRVTLFCSRGCEVSESNERGEDDSRIRRQTQKARS